jgi:putative ABC transport system permease protein
VDAGFATQQTLALRVTPHQSTCDAPAACVALYADLLRRVHDVGGVSDVAAASAVPLASEQPLLPVELEGHPLAETAGIAPLVWAGAVTPGYFRVMRVPIVGGRAFEETDGANAAPVVVVSAATARRYWPGQEAVGKRVRVVWDDQWREVVGVAGDVRHYALSGRTPADITGAVYMPYPQSVALNRRIPTTMALLVRTPASVSEIGAELRARVSRASPDVPVGEVRALEAVAAASMEEPRSMMWLFASFAACAILLAAIGAYGVVSYSTAQRTYEIGVRVAVGATRRDIYGLVLGQSVRLVIAGLAAGIAAAVLVARTLAGFLYGVSATDPATFAAVAAVLVVTALLAGLLPARRAASIDPVRALRLD